MHPYIAEFLGTAILVLLGNGVVANVLLPQTKGHGSGWLVITTGWALAVFVGVYITAGHSGAHLNPAVSLALCLSGQMSWVLFPYYILAQVLGAGVGSFLVWVMYRHHYIITEDNNTIQASFCTGPAIRNIGQNLISEIIGTFTLILGIFYIVAPSTSLGSLDALPVSFLVWSIGLSLGGTTGYAINPARDFGPRIVYYLLYKGRGGAFDINYAWIPVIGPFCGAVLAYALYSLIQ